MVRQNVSGLIRAVGFGSVHDVALIGFGGTFVVFTFLSPLLTDITGVPKESINIAWLLFGGATVVGNLAGGNLSDLVSTRKAMMILLCGLIVSFVFLRLAIHNEIATFAVIAVWGVFAFAIPPVMQAGVVATAQEAAPMRLGPRWASTSRPSISAYQAGLSLEASSWTGPGCWPLLTLQSQWQSSRC